MIRRIVNRLMEVVEIIKDKGLIFFIRRFIYCNTVTVLVEKELMNLDDLPDYQLDSGLVLTSITQDILKRNRLSYPVKSEYFRALNYIQKGYHGYALLREQQICGYIWYARLGMTGETTIHPEAALFGITKESDAAYMFSMYIDPKERGKNLATYLQTKVFHHLIKQGIKKAYGNYELKNIPALWVHRMLKWKELKKFNISQFIFRKKATAL